MRKGFTLIELVVSIFITSILLGFIILIPRLVYDTKNTVDVYYEYTETLKLLHMAIQKDLSKDNKPIIEENNSTVVINDVKYEFRDSGVYRTNGDKTPQKLTDRQVYYELNNKLLRLYTDKDNNNNEIDLNFNLEYTTIQKGRL